MSNEDEDEVEDELESMIEDAFPLPKVPSQALPHEVIPGVSVDAVANHAMPDIPTSFTSQDPVRLQRQRERAKARKVALHA